MSPRTAFLSRLIGLYTILVSLSMITNKQATMEKLTGLLSSAPLLFVVGVMVVAAGLAMVLGHNVWKGGALTVIVTIIGWLTLIKGVVFLLLSPQVATAFYLGTLHYEQFFYLYLSVGLLLGIYLTYGGAAQRRAQSPN
jgi:hypothetical protein